jgi:hypothetical protein
MHRQKEDSLVLLALSKIVWLTRQFPLHSQRRRRMKYGEHLKANIEPEYGPDPYLNYERLDDLIRELSATAPSRYVPHGPGQCRDGNDGTE